MHAGMRQCRGGSTAFALACRVSSGDLHKLSWQVQLLFCHIIRCGRQQWQQAARERETTLLSRSTPSYAAAPPRLPQP